MGIVAKAATAALAARDQFAWWTAGHGNTMSDLGTLEQPRLPHFLHNNPLPHGKPWGLKNSWNTNYYDETPYTGVTRYYDWTITKGPCAPDGVETTCVLVNGQFPGPTIEANWGDWFQISVKNEIEDEGTSIHWHGILQKGTPYMDGVPGFGQCPIAPGGQFTYRFQADLYGTSWYHSHWSSQYGSGLAGPMIIYGPNQTTCDEDLGPIMVGDWYHDYYQTVLDALFQPLPAVNIPASDNNLINGKNSFDCAATNKTCTPNAPLANFNFTSGKTYRLRLINPSAAAVQKITIDNHKFTVIANDFVEVQPYETDVITLAVGQRSDVLVKATGSPIDAVWLRGYKPPPCWPSKGGDEVKAAIFYQDADKTTPPTTSPGPNAYSQDCANDPLTQTVPIMKLAAGDATSSEVMPLEFRSNGTNLLWFMANRTMRVNYNDPILLEAKLGNFDFPYIENVHNYGTNKSLRFIVENPTQQPHPMHVHGHNMFILAEGFCNYTTPGGPPGGPPGAPANETDGAGAASKRGLEIDYNLAKRQSDNTTESPYGKCWDGSITNAANPARRDVQMLPAYSYVVLQWNQDNPGVWPFHCHIAWHLSAGFVWTVLEQPQAIQREMQIPSIMAQTCRDWSAWSGDHVVDQIDDGL